MPRTRPSGSNLGPPPTNQVSGSLFDPAPAAPLKLPSGLPAQIRKIARAVLADAPHLEQCNVDQLIRLAELRVQRDEMQAILAEEGLTVMRPSGMPAAHPLLSAVRSAESNIVSLERQLLLSASSRRQNLGKADRTPRTAAAKPVTPHGDPKVARLRLA